MTRAIVPGSFDPVTMGHLDIIARAAGLFEMVIVAVGRNSSKQTLFDVEERVTMLREACAPHANVRVEAFEGLTVAFAEAQGATVIVRGLRAVSDYEYETQIALMNRRLNSGVETVYLVTGTEFSYLSSSIVKEIARLGGAIEGLVPAHVQQRLREKVAGPAR